MMETMLIFETNRMKAKSVMSIEDGLLVEKPRSTTDINLLALKPMTGMENGFVFFDKVSGEMICHIGFTKTRNIPYEISYGTETPFRKQGYMTEAVSGFVKWVFSETEIPFLCGLPSGDESARVVKRCGFSLTHLFGNEDWYCIEKPERG